MDCDSNLRRDAEKLRPILSEVPTAISELNTYQRNRNNIKNLAYVSTVGILLAMGGSWAASHYYEGLQQVSFRNLFLIPGLAIAGGSLAYGLTLLQVNEQHLMNAVDLYNEAKPDKKIELQFSARINF